MKKIVDFLYGSESFELIFDSSLGHVIWALNSSVSRRSGFKDKSEKMVGYVSERKVKIQRVIPNLHNSFKPILVGSFSSAGDKTTLSGELRFERGTQIFMTIWFGFMLLALIFTSKAALQDPEVSLFVPLFPVFMLCAGTGLVKLGKWFSRNDKQWLLTSISKAIERDK